MKKLERLGEAEIRIFDSQSRRRNRGKILCHNHGGGLGLSCRRCIFRIGNERKFARSCLLDSAKAGNFDVRRAVVQAGVKGGCDSRKFHGGVKKTILHHSRAMRGGAAKIER